VLTEWIALEHGVNLLQQLEYDNLLWNPYQKQGIKALEKVQMRATRLVTALRDKPYQERLRTLDLRTLKFRRLRGDMIETYKVLSGIYGYTCLTRNTYNIRVCYSR